MMGKRFARLPKSLAAETLANAFQIIVGTEFNLCVNGVSRIFLKILPALLLMRRPKKTRLRWMMEIPNVSLPATSYSGSPTELPRHLPASLAAKPKMDVMELSDLHHPNCKINRKNHTGGSSGSGPGAEALADRRGSESSDSVLLSPEATKATEAVEFIAEHLRNEDLYIQVGAFL